MAKKTIDVCDRCNLEFDSKFSKIEPIELRLGGDEPGAAIKKDFCVDCRAALRAFVTVCSVPVRGNMSVSTREFQ